MGKSPEERFFAKVQPTGFCWLWTAYRNPKGYGAFGEATGVNKMAHRWSYEFFIGPIPDGLQIDHLCRVPACVNPDHLEAVTPKVNTHRGMAPSAVNARKTHCPQGHEYTPENTYRKRDGGRTCKACTFVRDSKKRKRE